MSAKRRKRQRLSEETKRNVPDVDATRDSMTLHFLRVGDCGAEKVVPRVALPDNRSDDWTGVDTNAHLHGGVYYDARQHAEHRKRGVDCVHSVLLCRKHVGAATHNVIRITNDLHFGQPMLLKDFIECRVPGNTQRERKRENDVRIHLGR